jgi:hypothetical protein
VKTSVCICLLTILVAPTLILSEEVRGNHTRIGNDSFVVSGIGYPPIKAENSAQARLMARRAAILDAYRNALSGTESPPNDEQLFYTGLSGFVKGMTIEREEYLEDGGVRIFARIPARSATLSPKTTKKDVAEKGTGPSAIPLNEWYRIIERSVKFE